MHCRVDLGYTALSVALGIYYSDYRMGLYQKVFPDNNYPLEKVAIR